MSHQNSNQTTKLIKTIVIGKVSVGKSSLILKYTNRDNTQPRTTVGIDILLRKVSRQGQTYSLQLWDTAGHQRYRTVVNNYFSHAQAAVVVFDLDDEDSLQEARIWLQQAAIYCGVGIPKVLLGNKSDKFDENTLARILEGYKQKIDFLKKQFCCEFYPVSAMTGFNLEKSFSVLVQKATQQIGLHEFVKTIKLHTPIEFGGETTVKKRSSCC